VTEVDVLLVQVRTQIQHSRRLIALTVSAVYESFLYRDWVWNDNRYTPVSTKL